VFDLNRGLEPLRTVAKFPFGTWDIEASDWWNLQMIGFFDGEHYYHFRTVPAFLEYILQYRYRGMRIFAHFGGRYDLNFVFDYLRTREDIDVSFYCSGAMVVQMTLRYRGVTVKLCDSYRLFQASLAKLGIAFDVKHKKTEIDFTHIEYNRQTIEYNEQDCRCLYEVIERFFEETGVFSETFASHALRVWRKDFLKQTIWKPPDKVIEFARSAYHGGRVEVYKREASNLNAYDVNSMYPYVMLSPMPVEWAGERKILLDLPHYGFVDAEVKIPESYVPCLPVRFEKLFFPTGTIRRVWTNEELIYAEAHGVRIQRIFKGYYFKTVEIFREYIEKLYALKRHSGEPTRTIAKLLMNALYGKFGQNPRKKMYCLERMAPNGATPVINPDGLPTGFAYYERTTHNAYLLPHLAAAVTSKARLHLLKSLNDSVYYCDTDSVFTRGEIETGTEIGEWSEVGKGDAHFYQPKLYKFAGKWKAKGLNQHKSDCKDKNKCDCGSESIDAFVRGSVNHVLRSRSIKEALRDGLPATAHIAVEKQLRESRPKREWIANGDTRPWTYEEISTNQKFKL